jgi:hypothetical protein
MADLAHGFITDRLGDLADGNGVHRTALGTLKIFHAVIQRRQERLSSPEIGQRNSLRG